MAEHNAIAEGLKTHGGKKPLKPKHLKEFHAKEQHDGTFHVKRHSGNPKEGPLEHSAPDLEAVHDALEDHMGEPAPEGDAGQAGGGAPVPPAPGLPGME